MSKRGKHYSRELKQKVLQELQSKAVSEVSEAYGISAQTPFTDSKPNRKTGKLF